MVCIFSFSGFAQEKNKIVIDESSEKPMIVGYTTREAFKDTNFAWWFNSGYENYEVDTAVIDNISERLILTDITIVMGTWCSDSREEVPGFLKILDYADFPEDQIVIISVDRSKEIKNVELEETPDIELVPTFIFYYDGVEIGRITERPEETLEKDMTEIVKNQVY